MAETGPETARLSHRAFEVEDAGFFAINSDLEVMRYTSESPIESVDARLAIVNYPN